MLRGDIHPYRRTPVARIEVEEIWNWAMADLRLTHPKMFTLAEDEDKAQELTESAFDMYYGWTLHHIMNDVAQGKQSVEDLWAYFAKADTTIRPEAIRMNFISNHDENSWNGTEQERMGEAVNLFAAFCYVVPGMRRLPAQGRRRLPFSCLYLFCVN